MANDMRTRDGSPFVRLLNRNDTTNCWIGVGSPMGQRVLRDLDIDPAADPDLARMLGQQENAIVGKVEVGPEMVQNWDVHASFDFD
ncbi:hypothetical protein [Defluviimonas salinarum]|nr:hypothetical protein [Defluviimonas salinarum]